MTMMAPSSGHEDQCSPPARDTHKQVLNPQPGAGDPGDHTGVGQAAPAQTLGPLGQLEWV